MTPRMASLIEDAKQAGYDVASDGTVTYITKFAGRGRATVGLVIHEDGTAFDMSVPLSVAKGIRSYSDMRHVLRIGRQ